jgi:lycopene beta-cyclase
LLKSNSYDYIICGAGCAGLSLLMRMIRSGKFRDKRILLLDKELKNKNDRTWCFWEKEKGFFEDVVYKRWDSISFLSKEYSSLMDIAPYQYKMIRGIDFYQYCFNEIAKHTNVEVVYGDIKGWRTEKKTVIFNINNEEFQLGDARVFNSIYQPRKATRKTITLLQHFKGWILETSEPFFNPNEATMMDFRVHQQHGTAFAYVLPFSTNSALVEYTLFTKELLLPEQYDKELKDYIRTFLGIDEYKVNEEEFGIIPMTNEKFSFNGHGWQIGVAGGQTKASSGYTFQFIQKQSANIIGYLTSDKPLGSLPGTAKRFRFYDNTLLHVLYYERLPGIEIFTRLFQRNKPRQVLRFLDNESSFKEELKIISTLPAWPFLKAAITQL